MHHEGPLTLGELAEHERIAPPSITKVVAKLEADGLLERQVDPADRASAACRTTKAARPPPRRGPSSQDGLADPRIQSSSNRAEQARIAAALDLLDRLPPRTTSR